MYRNLYLFWKVIFPAVDMLTLITGNPKTGTLANSKDSDEMRHFISDCTVCSEKGQSSQTEVYLNLEIIVCDPCKSLYYTVRFN